MQFQAILIILLGTVLILGCHSRQNEIQHKIDKEWYKYSKAMELNDYGVAKNCVYEVIALDSNNHSYYDTLARLYFATKDLESAQKSAIKALNYKMSESALRIAYESSLGMKQTEDVARLGEMLLEIHQDSIPLQYEMAFNYIQLYDYLKAEKLLNAIILHPKSLTKTYQEYRGDGVQSIPYRSASYNLLGFINNELKKPEIAKQMFKSALDISPEYILAEENLKFLETN